MKKMPKKTALGTALYFLKFRPRSVFEIERKLKQKKYPLDEIKKTINTLKKEKLLNDKQFAIMWLRTRNSLKPSGRRLVFWELKKLGLAENIIEKTLENDDTIEIDKAKKAIQSKINIYKNLDKYKKKQKILQFLSRRGFDYQTSKEALEELKIN